VIYRWFVGKQAAAGWERLSRRRFKQTRSAEDVHAVFLADTRWPRICEVPQRPESGCARRFLGACRI
jgi:hypothetical protein